MAPKVVFACVSFVLLVTPHGAAAQTPTPQVVLPDVTVTAQKEPAKAQNLALSISAITAQSLERAGVTTVSDAAFTVPNTVFTEFSARKLSNARFRGIGSSPANPAITTFLDGIPQFNANTSSIELVGVEQVEFVRGPQSPLHGRNTLGGMVNITSARPSLTTWAGQVVAPLGNFGSKDVRAQVSGPLSSKVGLSVAGGHSERDGFTTNSVTGNTIDDRKATFGKAQLMWTPTAQFETRLIVSGERSRDGDYTLGDLAAIRTSPFTVARDFEGRQDRDVASGTVLARFEGTHVSVTSTTGLVKWKTQDVTDLDYSPMSLVTRDNAEEATQFSQEVRFASAAAAPIKAGGATLAWQAGVFGFSQQYEQDAINMFSPFVLSPFINFPVSQHTPQGTLEDRGIGVFGQTTLTYKKVDVTVGLRGDNEKKEADLRTFFDPQIASPAALIVNESWGNVSPNASVALRVGADSMIYASSGRGFKAGGFNPAAPAEGRSYDEERTWNSEAGVKSAWAGGRVIANASVFFIDWTDLQLNLPVPLAPGQFYISNVGGATSRGVELEVTARATAGVDVFGSIGITRARFDNGTRSSGVDVSDNLIPFTPGVTASAGVQFSRDVRPGTRAFGRAEIVRHGSFHYDDANSASQDAYALVNARAGVQIRRISVEGWVKNAFDTKYVPIAFAYPGLAPSGFVGEPGRPRTFGVSLGVSF
jgi:iron complex outermembrane receptor protein